MLAASAADAQIFISATGNDANICSRTAPCRTLQRGINATGAGREMQILDSGEFGRATITKSITISAVGVSATVRSLTSGSNAIVINSSTAVVALRGLMLLGGGTGLRGINITAAQAVHIENCDIERFSGSGIRLAANNTELFVIDSRVRQNGADGLIVTGTTSAKLSVDNSTFENNADDGIDVEGIEATITRSVMAGNGSNGVEQTNGRTNGTWATAASNGANGFDVTGAGQMTLEFSVARGNAAAGLHIGTGATGRLSNSTFTDNDAGVQNDGGTALTRETSTIEGNTNATPIVGGGNKFDPI
jgi:hypothetical protein